MTTHEMEGTLEAPNTHFINEETEVQRGGDRPKVVSEAEPTSELSAEIPNSSFCDPP